MTARSPDRPKVLDLFAGAGGLALGLHAAGAQCVGAVEYNAAAAATFRRIFAADDPLVFGGPVEGDVNELPVTKLLDSLPAAPDLVVGGPPCQGFSRVGRAKQASLLSERDRIRNGGLRAPGRNHLYQYFLAVVAHARPQAFIMENVPGMRQHLGGDFARRIAREASYIGYNVRYFLLNAANYGVPQHRWRLFFVGMRSDLGLDAVPRPPVGSHHAQQMLEGFALPEDPWLVTGSGIPLVPEPASPVKTRDALGDLPKLKAHLRGESPVERRLPPRRSPSEFVEDLRQWPGLEPAEMISGNWYRHTPRDFPIFQEMAQGDRYPEALAIAYRLFREHVEGLDDPPSQGTREWNELKSRFVPPYRNDAFHDKWRKLMADEPSWTVTAHLSRDAYSHIHYDGRQARTITIREAARLQSFPDAVDFAGNYGEQYQQIGNAVPPVLARALGEAVLGQLAEVNRTRQVGAG